MSFEKKLYRKIIQFKEKFSFKKCQGNREKAGKLFQMVQISTNSSRKF